MTVGEENRILNLDPPIFHRLSQRLFRKFDERGSCLRIPLRSAIPRRQAVDERRSVWVPLPSFRRMIENAVIVDVLRSEAREPPTSGRPKSEVFVAVSAFAAVVARGVLGADP